MCRTIYALLQTLTCGLQLMVRILMTVILMIENLVRMLLQSIYNCASFVVQLLTLIPICAVLMITARLKCFLCSGGGNCPINRNGGCDCIISALVIVILFMTFRSTGILDKIIYKFGYVKARPPRNVTRVQPVEPNPELPPPLLRRIPQNEENINKVEIKHDMKDMGKATTTVTKNDKPPKEKNKALSEQNETPKQNDTTTNKTKETPKQNDTTTKEDDMTIPETQTDITTTDLPETKIWTTTKVAADTIKDKTKRSMLCGGGSSKDSSKSNDMDYSTTISWTTILYYLV